MLGLKRASDPAWARVAMSDLDSVLVDHAHCEMKAAANAMALCARMDRAELVLELVALAREELDHFARVVRELEARGVPLGQPPVDAYAAELRKRVQAEAGHRDPIVDRLLVAALIEARSCERFKLLLAAMGEAHPMHALYSELFEAEARHYRTFVDLAIAQGGEPARARLERVAEIEASVVAELGAPLPVVHG